jgi:hypothetical protein
MKTIQLVKYPCGYEWKLEVSGFSLILAFFSEHPLILLAECPIHKDKCKAVKQLTERKT